MRTPRCGRRVSPYSIGHPEVLAEMAEAAGFTRTLRRRGGGSHLRWSFAPSSMVSRVDGAASARPGQPARFEPYRFCTGKSGARTAVGRLPANSRRHDPPWLPRARKPSHRQAAGLS